MRISTITLNSIEVRTILIINYHPLQWPFVSWERQLTIALQISSAPLFQALAPLKKSMIYYWLLFCLPVVGLLSPVYLSPRLRLVAYSSYVMLIVLFIGFRYQIGGDWANYLEQFNRIHDEGIRVALNRRSIGYGLVNWISAQIGWGIYGVNVICGIVFVSGLTLFCNRQPVPWLSWIIALPYLVVVVGMGYTAQSVAVGLILYGFVLLEDRRRWGFVVAVGSASVFHKTSIALLPLLLFTVNLDQVRIIVKLVLKRPLPTLISVALSGLAIIYILWRIFYDDFQILMEYYVVRTQWESHGAFCETRNERCSRRRTIVVRQKI